MGVKPLPQDLEDTLAPLTEELPEEQRHEIDLAYRFAREHHAGARRPTGELYLHHGLGVAELIAGLGMDGYCIAAAMLHHILLPHTGLELTSVERTFHKKTVDLIRGLQDIESYEERNNFDARNDSDDELEQIRRALLILVHKDVHVILIRMADYVLDLRYAARLGERERHTVAAEAMNIYAPLANRLGVWQLKWELEDLSFRYLEPERYRDIASRLNTRRTERDRVVQRAISKLQAELKEAGINAQVTGRAKHIYSIYRKMKRKQLSFEDIYDKHALRVIIFTGPDGQRAITKSQRKKTIQEARALCYQALGMVHSLWQPIPNEFDDYIANPKSNGYQSLHTAVMDEDGQTLEVQIRTDVMHTEAERGVAAHWAYKEDVDRPSPAVARYVQSLRRALNTPLQDANEDELSDAEVLQSELLEERILVYTPRGDTVDLPRGSTPVDFAYTIHSEVGHRCRGAKVNGKMVTLDQELESGDRVEILTGKKASPSRNWMNPGLGYATNPRTRSKVRRWFRQQERDQNIEQGQDIVQRELKRLGLNDTIDVEEIAGALSYDDVEEFLAAVGFGDLQTVQISGAISKLQQKLKPDDELLELFKPKEKSRKGLTVLGVSGLHTKMAGCCNPIPPEPIKGYITRGSGVTIHRADCKTMLAITDRERIVDVSWGVDEETYPIPLVVTAFRRNSLPEEISKVLRGRNVEVTKTKAVTKGNTTKVLMVVQVSDLNELDWVLRKLETLPSVLDVRRQRWVD